MEIPLCGESGLLATFLQGRSADPAIDDTEIVQVDIRSIAGACAKLTALGPSPLGKVFGTDSSVHGAVDRPVKRIADSEPLGGGVPCRRNQKSGVAGFASYRMRRVREVKDGESVQQEVAVIDAGVGPDIDNNSARLKLPIRVWEFAGRDAAFVNDIVIGAGLLDHFTGKCERRSRGQDGPAASETQSRGCGNVVEAA